MHSWTVFCIVCSEIRIYQLKTPTHTATTIFIMAAYFVHVWITKEFMSFFLEKQASRATIIHTLYMYGVA